MIPFSRSKNCLLHLGPAAEVVDREELRAGVGNSNSPATVLVHRPVAGLAEDALRLLRADVVEEGGGLLRRVLRHRDRVLDQDRLVRDDVVEVLALLLGEDRLVLVGEQDVALAAGEGLERLARALVLDGRRA